MISYNYVEIAITMYSSANRFLNPFICLCFLIVCSGQNTAPLFSRHTYTVLIEESHHVLTDVYTVEATDSEAFTYRLDAAGLVYFGIDPNSGIITLTNSLDRESMDTIKFKVIADDSVLQSSAIVLVLVGDSNDNAPRFTGTPFQGNTAESTAPGVSVLQVSAEDDDIGQNKQILFSLDSTGNTAGAFRIDSVTGIIRVGSALDYETINHYSLTVIATDLGAAPLSASTGVFIAVDNVQDGPPRFLNASYSGLVSEGSGAVGTSIVQVLANDGDTGSLENVLFEITDGDPSSLFTIGTDGVISIQTPLDREQNDSYTLVVRAVEKSEATSSSFVTVSITVTDINDNPPEFDQPSYTIEVSEGEPMGRVLYTGISARDGDIGTNAVFGFTISGSVFGIEANTGNLVVMAVLDRETTPSYSFTVSATETMTQEARAVTVPLTITLTDENDVTPYFATQAYTLHVQENQPVGTSFAAITASDDDLGLSGMLNYSLAGAASSAFTVNSAGDISTDQILDRESVGEYIVSLLATDLDPLHPRIAAVQIIISVNDTNDNDPFFDPPAYYQSVSEAATPNTLVIQVAAMDMDEGINAEVVYSLDPVSNPGGLFLISSSSGSISVVGQLDADSPASSSHTLTVVATDKGEGGRKGSCVVVISVLDVNDEDPTFLLSTYRASVSEAAGDGVSVLSVLAVDNDTSHNALIKYAIDSSSSHLPFRINLISGVISVVGTLDRETSGSFSFTVIAFDSAVDSNNGTATVEIELTDENDNPPVFSQEEYPLVVAEDTNVGVTVLRLEGSDRDAGVNKMFNFTLISGNIPDTFSLSPSDGSLTISSQPQWSEAQNSFELTVEIRDQGTPPLSSTALVRISISDTNNQNPEFVEDPYSFVVTEGSGSEATIGRLLATDGDNPSLSFGQVRYSIGNGNTHGAFSLNSTTGELSVSSVANSPDRENISSYTLQVQASDLAPNPRHNFVAVLISVLDINDNSPQFSQPAYSSEVEERSGAGRSIITVSATDRDEGTNRDIEYSIVSGNEGSMFSIHPDSGLVSTTGILTDRETTETHTLTLHARDKGSTPRIGTTELVITVLDINDNSPVFLQSTYILYIPENATANTQLGTVSARDLDLSENSTISYSLAPGGTAPFGVIIGTNIIVTTGPLNREVESFYNFMVRASDMGSPPRVTDVVVNVLITDVNDNNPVFLNSDSSVNVSENVQLGSQIFQVSIEDLDEGLNKKVVYFLSGDDGKFGIGRDSGSLFTISSLDREEVGQYLLTVTARDGGDPSLVSEFSLQVNVTDINDNPPTFQASYDLLVSEEHSVSVPITALSATDTDAGSNAVVSYKFQNSSSASNFTLSPTGELSLSSSLDFEEVRGYLLTALATDAGSPPLSESVLVNVTVVDENDNTPVFSEPFYRAGVQEAASHGTSVLIIAATDRDSNDYGSVGFEINEPTATQRHFDIHASTGQVTTEDVFVGRVGTIYQTMLTAYDNNKKVPSNSVTTNLTVTVVSDFYIVLSVIACGPSVVIAKLDSLVSSFEMITDSLITIYDVTPHIEDNIVDLTKTDVYVFGVTNAGNLIPQSDLVRSLDENQNLVEATFQCDIESVLGKPGSSIIANYDPIYWSLIAVLGVIVCLGITCCLVLFCQARRHRRRQYKGSKDSRFESVMNSLADMSNISSRFFNSSAAIDNPLYRGPYEDWSSAQSTKSLHYESQELIMEMFEDTQSMETFHSFSRSLLLPHGSEYSSDLVNPFDHYDSQELQVDFRDLYSDNSRPVTRFEAELVTEDDLEFVESDEGSISVI